MAGKLPSSGAISISDLNTNVGNSSTATTTFNDNLVRCFAAARTGAVSLGDARGKAVTYTGTLAQTNTASGVTLTAFSLVDGTYFTAGQFATGQSLYVTTYIDDSWWAPVQASPGLGNPKNLTYTMGSTQTIQSGGTGGSKNYYAYTTYTGGSNTLGATGGYSGSSTGNPNGRVNITYLSLITAGSGY